MGITCPCVNHEVAPEAADGIDSMDLAGALDLLRVEAGAATPRGPAGSDRSYGRMTHSDRAYRRRQREVAPC